MIRAIHIRRVSSFPQLCRRFLQVSAARQEVFEVKDVEEFQTRVVKSSLPVVVAFHAAWCGPCQLLAPLLEKGVQETAAGRVDLARVDVDQLSELALEYEVSAVPAVLGVKDGEVKAQFVGLQNQNFVNDFIDKLERT